MLVVLLVIFLALVGGGLVLLFRQMMQKDMTNATAHLQALNQEYLRKQEELKGRIAEADKHYRDQLATAKIEVERMRTQAVQEVESMRQRLIAEARQESEQLIQKATDSKEAIRRELEEAIERKVLDSVVAVTGAALSQELAQIIQNHWLDELIMQGLASLKKLDMREPIREASVASAVALTAQQRQKLLQQLKHATGMELQLNETVKPELIAGLTITLGHTVLDGSLASRLERSVRQLRNGHG